MNEIAIDEVTHAQRKTVARARRVLRHCQRPLRRRRESTRENKQIFRSGKDSSIMRVKLFFRVRREQLSPAEGFGHAVSCAGNCIKVRGGGVLSRFAHCITSENKRCRKTIPVHTCTEWDIHARARTHTHSQRHKHTDTRHTHTHTDMQADTSARAHTHKHMHTHTHRAYVRLLTQAPARARAHTHTHTHTHTPGLSETTDNINIIVTSCNQVAFAHNVDACVQKPTSSFSASRNGAAYSSRRLEMTVLVDWVSNANN